MKLEANNITTVLVHPRYTGGRNKFVNYVCSRRGGRSSFEFLRYRDPFRNQLRRKEQPMRLAQGMARYPCSPASAISGPRGCATSAETFSFPVQSSGVFARIDTPGDQIRPGENLKSGFTSADPFVETAPACRFVISCLITVHRTVVSPPLERSFEFRAYLQLFARDANL